MMNSKLLPKSLVDFMLLAAVICAGSSLLNGASYDLQPHTFINNIPASTEPLEAVRLILGVTGADGNQNNFYIEPTDMGDPYLQVDTFLVDGQDPVRVALEAEVYRNGMVERLNLGTYNPAAFRDPGIFEFSLGENNDLILTKDDYYYIPLTRHPSAAAA